ncbi:hypothetical protein J437_LFUL015019 [Ladona fulva]|uniref:Uncharacterized protein n=1 Tax=Ladona fulva TaxID=123851 RepID=A0A8K0KFG5_LADFU|nr:hypothetical protein J437_LFUL015019 [Ladona fulva]
MHLVLWQTNFMSFANIVLVVCTLHNFLLLTKDSCENYSTLGFADSEHPETHEIIPGNWCKDRKILWTYTTLRHLISPYSRLAVTLRFLASRDSYTSLIYTKQSISENLPEVCEAIITTLKQYVMVKGIFLTALAVLMVNIQILGPEHSRSLYFNYKGKHSIVLMAFADANYNRKIQQRMLQLPNPEPLLSREELVPFVFVVDDAFTLSENIMKPYPGQTWEFFAGMCV